MLSKRIPYLPGAILKIIEASEAKGLEEEPVSMARLYKQPTEGLGVFLLRSRFVTQIPYGTTGLLCLEHISYASVDDEKTYKSSEYKVLYENKAYWVLAGNVTIVNRVI